MEKTASQIMKETFNSAYHLWISYCEFVIFNLILLDLLEDKKDYIDYGLPTFNLEMRF